MLLRNRKDPLYLDKKYAYGTKCKKVVLYWPTPCKFPFKEPFWLVHERTTKQTGYRAEHLDHIGTSPECNDTTYGVGET